ncbi:MAG: methylated-DNA--[protein]-cysteine S-methyltransferase [Clostridiales bacterium]|nr:methylated-DNA--[protein]-cysteine S-methyltransferase [Clostridiales bacterium]
MYYKTIYPSPIGPLCLACDKTCENLVGLWIQGQKYHGGSISDKMIQKDDVALFDAIKAWLDRYFAGESPDASKLPLALSGSPFRQEVLNILREIPYGELISYGDIAKKMAEKMGRKSMSSQAVGGAVGHNPISIIIPCHRVIGSTGSLTGYASGLETKIKLLELEGVDTSKFSLPKKGTAL